MSYKHATPAAAEAAKLQAANIAAQRTTAQRLIAESALHAARFEAQQAAAGIALAQDRKDRADERLAAVLVLQEVAA